MSNRFLASFSRGLGVVALVRVLAPAPAVAQTKSTALLAAKEGAKTWTPPRHADGEPDISGHLHQLRRDAARTAEGSRREGILHPEEAEAYAKKAARRQGSDRSREPTTTCTTTWRSSASRRSRTRSPSTIRTSLIVGPEGRVPAAAARSAETPGGQARP